MYDKEFSPKSVNPVLLNEDETPSHLSDLELQGKKIGKKQVRIDATKIKKIMQDHTEMTLNVIKALPYLLNDPILILDSKTVSGRLVLFGEVYANGKPVMMALEINPSTRSGNSTYVDVIKVASAYTRNNTQNMINTSNIRFICKNKSRVENWLKVNRLQLPLPNTQLNSTVNSIPDSEEKVNTSVNNSEKNNSDAMYSDRDSESFSSRSLLANALESAAKEGEERTWEMRMSRIDT